MTSTGRRPRLQLLLGYGVSSSSEIVPRATYYKTERTGVAAGTLNGKPLLAFFEPERTTRRSASSSVIASTWRPRRGSSRGSRRSSACASYEILVTFASQEAGSSIAEHPVLKEGAVPVFGLDLGFSFDLGQHFFIGVDTGLRYQTAPPAVRLPPWPDEDRRQRRPLDRAGRRECRVSVLAPSTPIEIARVTSGRRAPSSPGRRRPPRPPV